MSHSLSFSLIVPINTDSLFIMITKNYTTSNTVLSTGKKRVRSVFSPKAFFTPYENRKQSVSLKSGKSPEVPKDIFRDDKRAPRSRASPDLDLSTLQIKTAENSTRFFQLFAAPNKRPHVFFPSSAHPTSDKLPPVRPLPRQFREGLY